MPLHLHCQSYQLPLCRPWPVSTGQPRHLRQGLLIYCENRKEGLKGIGDCAPLPAAGTETLQQARRRLDEIVRHSWESSRQLSQWIQQQRTRFPALCMALDCALLDMEARRGQCSLRHLLDENAASQVQFNSMAGDVCNHWLLDANAQGTPIVKLKLAAPDTRSSLNCLQRLIPSLPQGYRLRLDANQAWSLEEARQMLDALADFPIESLEEPLRDPNLADMDELQQRVPFPLALDESLNQLELKQMLEQSGIRRLILKPAVLGGLRHTLDIAHQCLNKQREVIITTVVDSAVGVMATAQLAGALEARQPGMAHGLDTSRWLCRDIASSPHSQAGYIHLPTTPGLGIDETLYS